jgi:hypothetical protein
MYHRLWIICVTVSLTFTSNVFADTSELDSTAYSQVRKLLASDGESRDVFGWSVAVDGETMVVGAIYVDDEGYDAGAVYVLQRNSGGAGNWGEVAKLTASDAQANDEFGRAVAVDGDVVVVGTTGEDSLGSKAGAAYVFHRNSGGVDNWGEVKKIMASDGGMEDYFGTSVSVDGDVIVVGSRMDDAAGIDAGAAYVFHRNSGGVDNWGQVKKIIGSDVTGGNYFGTSVAVSGDVIVVGSNGDDAISADAGAAYVFHRDIGGTDNWGESARITASDGEMGDWFGYSVAVDGDIIVVGAYHKNFSTGAAYIYGRNTGGTDTWGEIKKITASVSKMYDDFGFSVAVDADVIVVGSYGGVAGAAHVFHRNNGGVDSWGEMKRIISDDAESGDDFGKSVAVSADMIVAGAPAEDELGRSAGAVYVFRSSSSVGVVSTRPEPTALLQNTPNPFNPSTTIAFTLADDGVVSLRVYNALGQQVRTLVNRHTTAGHHTVTWNGRDDRGNAVASGVYLYRLVTGDKVMVKRMSMVR